MLFVSGPVVAVCFRPCCCCLFQALLLLFVSGPVVAVRLVKPFVRFRLLCVLGITGPECSYINLLCHHCVSPVSEPFGYNMYILTNYFLHLQSILANLCYLFILTQSTNYTDYTVLNINYNICICVYIYIYIYIKCLYNL